MNIENLGLLLVATGGTYKVITGDTGCKIVGAGLSIWAISKLIKK